VTEIRCGQPKAWVWIENTDGRNARFALELYHVMNDDPGITSEGFGDFGSEA